jgi:hypothetical protein
LMVYVEMSGFLLFVILRSSHLSALKLMSQLSSHYCSMSRSFCRILESFGDLIFL